MHRLATLGCPARLHVASLRRALRRADRNRQARQVVLATHGCEPTREAAMAAFAKSWRRESF